MWSGYWNIPSLERLDHARHRQARNRYDCSLLHELVGSRRTSSVNREKEEIDISLCDAIFVLTLNRLISLE